MNEQISVPHLHESNCTQSTTVVDVSKAETLFECSQEFGGELQIEISSTIREVSRQIEQTNNRT